MQASCDNEGEGASVASAYRPWDRDEKLGPVPEGGFKPDDPKVIAWEVAHGHDLRLKCLPEFGCQLRENEIEEAAREVLAAARFRGSDLTRHQVALSDALLRLKEALDA